MKLLQPTCLFQKVYRSGSVKKKQRLLGLDVGEKYVGLAVSDADNKIAEPVSVLVRKTTNIDAMAKDFRILVSKFSLGGFVVGEPCYVIGAHKTKAFAMGLFVEDLHRTGKLDGFSYTYWNESFTSKCVHHLVDDLNLPPVMEKTIMDKFAAVGILQGYLDAMHRELKSGDNSKKGSIVRSSTIS